MLKSDSYHQTLMKGLHDLKERNVGCDLTLTSKDGASFDVHRIIMAAASSYFMLKLDSEIRSGQIHVLKNIDGSCLEALVNFAYTGELDLGSIPKTAMWPLLSACTELQMTDALDLCHDYMAGNIVTPKPPRTSGRRAGSQLAVKMELDLPGVKQEGMADFGHALDDFEDDSFPAADDTYYTADSFDVGGAVVKLTPLEDNTTISEQYGDISTPKKRKRGRPRKGESPVVKTPTPGRRGRPQKKKQAADDDDVPYRPAARGRGRGRPRSTPKSTTTTRKRKQTSDVLKGQQCRTCGKVEKLNSLVCAHNRIKHNRRTYAHLLHKKLRAWNIGAHAIVQRDFESSKNVYGCSRCGEMFNMWTRWRRHYIKRHLLRHKCPHCKAAYSYPLDLYHHKHAKHKSKLVLKKRIGIKLPETAGRKRGQQLVSLFNLPHEAAVEFSDEVQPSTSFAPASKRKRKKPTGNEKVTCQECFKKINRRNYTNHLKMHLGERTVFDCPHCDKKFFTKQRCQDHVQIIHQGIRYKCTYPGCYKEFTWKRSLRWHLRSHEGNYTYKCEICDRGFFSNDFYQSHMNSHYGIKAYECGLCGKKYANPSGLTRHLRGCGSEKTEPCPHCDKLFASDFHVKEHIKYVHSDRPKKRFLCNLCGKTYCEQRRLQAHVARHEEEDKQERPTEEELHVITTTVDISQLDVIENVHVIEM